MFPRDSFRFCPRCAAPVAAGANPLSCPACGYSYFFNPCVAAAAFVADGDGRYIFLQRAKEPAAGMWTVPGGFIDIGESAEAALAREVREEVGLEITGVRFVCSLPNEYAYRGTTYPVCDLVFAAVAVNPADAAALDGAAAVKWARLEEVAEAELAFASVRRGRGVLLGTT